MNYDLTLRSDDEPEILDQLVISSPAVPRVGELITIQVKDRHLNLKVLDVAYNFEKVGLKQPSGDYGCVDISLHVQARQRSLDM